MASLYLLIPVALIFCFVVVKLFLWAIDSGQYDDLDREGSRILEEDGSAKEASNELHNEQDDA